MTESIFKDEAHLFEVVLKLVVICCLAALLIFFWLLPAKADVFMEDDFDAQLIQTINQTYKLSPNEKERWISFASQKIRDCRTAGLNQGLVLDLAQISLDAGWTVDHFASLCQKVITAKEAGRNATSAARNSYWRQITGRTYIEPIAALPLSPAPKFYSSRLEANKFMATLRRWLGTPYKYGGNDDKGIDCSGLVMQVYAEHGMSLPNGSYNQAVVGRAVSQNALRLGDIVVFSRPGNGVVHVGIYLSNRRFIHSSKGEGVHISSLDEPKYHKMYTGARRVAQVAQS